MCTDFFASTLFVGAILVVPPVLPLNLAVKTADRFVLLIPAYQQYAGVCFIIPVFIVKKPF
jgi:hypothetical protein